MDCQVHGNTFTLVCLTCKDNFLCIECFDDHPKEHNILSTSAVVKHVMSEKQNLLRQIAKDVTLLQKDIASVRATQKQQDDKEKEEKQKINDQRAGLHSIIDEIADSLLKVACTQKLKNSSVLQEDEALLNKHLQEKLTRMKAIKDMLEKPSELDIIQMVKHLDSAVSVNNVDSVAPSPFSPTPLEPLRFCAGPIDMEQIRHMFGRMADSSEEDELLSDFVGSIRKKSPNDQDLIAIIDRIPSSEVNFLALEFFSRGEGFRYQVKNMKYENGEILVQCTDDNVLTVIECKLKRFASMNKMEVCLAPGEQEKVQNVIKAVHDSISGVFCFQLRKDAGKRLWVMGEEYYMIQQAKCEIDLGLGRIQQGDTQRQRPFSEEQQLHITNDDTAEKYAGTGPTSYTPQTLDHKTETVAFTTQEGLDIKIYVGGILHLDVDCIVNAANENLKHGGGIARVISQAAGYEFDRESRDFVIQNGPVNVGMCCTTTAGTLGYKGVIHAVGPRWRPNDQMNCLRELKEAVFNSLLECDLQGMKSVAIPAISSGIFGVPKELTAQQYFRGVEEYSKQRKKSCCLKVVHFVDQYQGMVDLIQRTFRNNMG